MKKTKIVNGRREWANKDYVEEIQTCYANPNLGKGYFVDVWVHELLVGELGFLFMSGGEFFILASNEGDHRGCDYDPMGKWSSGLPLQPL